MTRSFATLADWLRWQETLNPRNIELGLERAQTVAQRLKLRPPARTVITVAGTNGKGSSVALLEAIVAAAAYRVGSYTSPHLLRYNERVRIAGQEATDAELCKAFAAVESARGDVPLTYFEFGTLAALWLLQQSRLEVAVLEVGLGGRLDAVNIVEPQLALITNIGLDHTDWLGADRESIGREKAGIFRAWTPAVCADPDPPASVHEAASKLGLRLMQLGRDFGMRIRAMNWDWQGWSGDLPTLPLPRLAGHHQLRNAAGAIAALQLLAEDLPVKRDAIEAGLRSYQLPGRFEVSARDGVELVYDVAHNLESAAALADNLRARTAAGRCIAVFGALRDKPVAAMLNQLKSLVHVWHLGGLPQLARGLTSDELQVHAGMLEEASVHTTIEDAYIAARKPARAGDRVLVWGSFHTVEAVKRIEHG
ncbi:MAG: bifunctional tetrahydrofolate synthase/dihydrofolate synthase [Nevskiales bacterium]